MKANPLSPTPPVPSAGQQHRLGSAVALEIREIFGHLDEGFDDIHRGVFLTDEPIVAYAYAEGRRVVGDNDFGLKDILDPPVIIGLEIDQIEEMVDTDAMVAAKNILEVAQLLRREDFDFDEYEPDEEFLRDYVRDPEYYLLDGGLDYLGGNYGNMPDAAEFSKRVEEVARMLNAKEVPAAEELSEMPDEILEYALKAASEMIPQSRLLREVTSDEVVSIVVIPPFRTNDEEIPVRDYPGDPEIEANADEIAAISEWFVLEGTLIYQRKNNRGLNRWHGTSLSIARKAFPDLVTPRVFEEGVRAGSAYDLDELEQEGYGEDEDE